MSHYSPSSSSYSASSPMSAFKDMSSLSPTVQTHLQKVYSSLFVGLLVASLGALVDLVYLGMGGLLSTLASVAMMLLVMATPRTPDLSTRRFLYFCAFCFFQGMSLGPLLSVAIFIDPANIFIALSGSSLVFLSFTISALFSQSRSFLYLGGMLGSGLSVLMWLSFFNLFFHSMAIANLQLYLGLMVMSGFILYDTQLIVEKAKLGNLDYLSHTIELFIDFVGVFVRLLIILSKNSNSRSEKKDERKRR